MQEISRTESQKRPPKGAPTPLPLNSFVFPCHTTVLLLFPLLLTLPHFPSPPLPSPPHFHFLLSFSFLPLLSEKRGVPAPHQDAGCRVPSTKWQHHLIQVAQLLGESSLTPKRLQAQFQVRSYTYAVGSIASWGTNGRQTDHSFFLSLTSCLSKIN